MQVLTQPKGGNDLVQCTTNFLDDQSQLLRQANGSLSLSKSNLTFGRSWACQSLLDVGSGAHDGGVDGCNV